MIHQPSDQIDLTRYIEILARHIKPIVLTTAIVTVTVMGIYVGMVESNTYQTTAVVSVPSIPPVAFDLIHDKSAIKTTDVINFISSLDAKVSATSQNPESPTVSVTAQGESLPEAQEKMKKALEAYTTYYNNIFNQRTKFIDEQIKLISEQIAADNERLQKANAMTNNLSPFNPAEAVALQGYLTSYNAIIERSYALKKDLGILESQRLFFKQAEILQEPSTPTKKNQKLGLIGSSITGLLLGILLSIFSVAIHEWWRANKKLMR